jgi:hypothetical protein
MSRGNATTSQTRGTRGHGVARGDGGMSGGDAGRSEAAVSVEAMRQPAGLEARERRNGRQQRNIRRGYATVMREDGASGRHNNQPWA